MGMKITRYPMCSDQLAQIDCRIETCVFHSNGACHNISPAITLSTHEAKCWSYLSCDGEKDVLNDIIGEEYVCLKIVQSGVVPPLLSIGNRYKIIDAKKSYRGYKVAVAFRDDGGKKRWYSLQSIEKNFKKAVS